MKKLLFQCNAPGGQYSHQFNKINNSILSDMVLQGWARSSLEITLGVNWISNQGVNKTCTYHSTTRLRQLGFSQALIVSWGNVL